MIKDSIGRYLTSYAHPVSRLLVAPHPTRIYAHVLTIPVFDESRSFLNRLIPEDAADLLIVLVVNAPSNRQDSDPALQRTLELWWDLQRHLKPDTANPQLCWGTIDENKNIGILVVDSVSPDWRLPPKAGVGTARKIAADIALKLIHQGVVETPWIHCTDADVSVPSGYFSATDCYRHLTAGDLPAACIYPFRHTSDDQNLSHLATTYELHLRYYSERLHHIGSPYAFHSLGSTLAIASASYARVRGFPQRSGAEDFYLLNKLLKTGPIVCLAQPCLPIEARLSHRVPFGTGPALARLSRTPEPLSYPLESFQPIEQFHKALWSLTQVPRHCHSWLPHHPVKAFQEMGMEQVGDQLAYHSRSLQRYQRGWLEWFDGFRLVRYLNICRARGMADQPLLATTRSLYAKPQALTAELNHLLYLRETLSPRIHSIGLPMTSIE